MRTRTARWAIPLVSLVPLAAAGCSSATPGTSSGESGPGRLSPTVETLSGPTSERGEDCDHDRDPIAATKRVLLFSIDGFHQSDLAAFIAAHPGSTLARLASTGVQYAEARTTTPSDSFPGMLALATGGTPKTTGVYYDDSYDRTLFAPGSDCTGTPGIEVVFDESVEYDDTKLFSGGINPAYLPRQIDADGKCSVVYPHDFVRVNTIFEVVRRAGGHTAWSDKHPAYDILNGPSGDGVEDLYAPEINSLVQNAPPGLVNGVDLLAALAKCDGKTNSLPLPKVSDYTTCLPTIWAYDDVKVQAIVNEIDGKRADGTGRAHVPTVFGMNFQGLSVAQKLPIGGYADASATPTAQLGATLEHIDGSLGRVVKALRERDLLESTLIIVSAKHGQAPIDPAKLAMEPGGHGNATVQDPLAVINTVDANVGSHPSSFVNPNSGSAYDTLGHLQTDDVGILWVQHSADDASTASIVSALEHSASAIFADKLPPGTIFAASISSGAPLAAIFGDPTSGDPVAAARAPDVFIQPNAGTIYSGSSKKVAEHGGGATDDTAVALLLSIPAFRKGRTVSEPVRTTQVAPTILRALHLDPRALKAVRQEGTEVLPALF